MTLLKKVIQEGLTTTCMTILNLDGNIGIFHIPMILNMKIGSLELDKFIATPKERQKIGRTIDAYKMLLDLLEKNVYVNTYKGYQKINITDIISGILK